MKWLRNDPRKIFAGGRVPAQSPPTGATAPAASDAAPDAAFEIDGRSGPIGFIDRVVNGTAFGWALDTRDDTLPLEISLCCGHRVVASGRADAYREDLAHEFGIAGRNGFALPLHTAGLQGSAALELRVAGTNEAIDAPAYHFPKADACRDLEFAIAGVRGVDLIVSVRNGGPDALAELSLLDGDRPVTSLACGIAAGEREVAIAIPTRLFDGQPHLLAVAEGTRGVVAAQVEVLAPVLTPWEHLKESFAAAKTAGLRRSDAQRYRSLQLQLRRPAAQVDPVAVMRAHDVVCEADFERERFEPLQLPHCAHPLVSVIIPVFERFAETYHCFASLILACDATPFEVIIADDASEDETADCEEILLGARVVRMPKNGGFNKNCNHAARQARGEYLVFLNNDTEVTSGWLEALVGAFGRFESVGMTGAKLLNENGSLQEAGGIVWGNGQPWNVGRDANPSAPEYDYARQVDYLSGAALCIDKHVWQQVGGFSSEFEPAYYEDTDLAFKVREAGYATWYVPDAEVVHFEGRSHGRDPKQGVKRHQALNAAKFKRKWVRAFAGNGEASAANLAIHKDRGIVSRALVIDYATPTPETNAGNYASVQEMRLLQSLGMKVTFAPENMAYRGVHTDALRAMGIECVNAPFSLSLEHFLQQRGREFDLIFVIRFDLAGRYLATFRQYSNAKIALNLCDLHFLRELRAANRGSIPMQQALDTREKELRVLREVDAVLTYSETEKAIILSHNLSDENVMRCPWVAEPRPGGREFEERSGLLFLGGFGHPPNLEALRWFVKEVQPQIDLPAAQKKLTIVGSATNDAIRELAEDNGDVEVLGFVEDLTKVFDRARVFVAPLLSGAGIKGKVIEAMSRGLPVAATSVASEATRLVDGVSAEIKDDAAALARAIERLAADRALWRRYRDAALATVELQFSAARGREEFSTLLDYLGVVHLPADPADAGSARQARARADADGEADGRADRAPAGARRALQPRASAPALPTAVVRTTPARLPAAFGAPRASG